MDALPLRELFAGLAGHDGIVAPPGAEPGALAGYEGLPEDLLIRAISSYADTAPAEVAEHLSPFVTSPIDAQQGLHLLAAAPTGSWEGEVSLTGDQDTPAIHDHSDAPDSSDVHDFEVHDFEVHDFDGHDFDTHLGALGDADSLDSQDHRPIVHPGAVTALDQRSTADTSHDHIHDHNFGHNVLDDLPDDAHDPSPTDADPLTDDATHVPLDDLSHDALDALDPHDAATEADSHYAPDPTGEPEHDQQADDGHHDPGLEHFAG